MASVYRLEIDVPYLNGSFSLDLPRNLFSEKVLARIDSFDTSRDGVIQVTTRQGNTSSYEASYGNGVFQEIGTYLARLPGDWHSLPEVQQRAFDTLKILQDKVFHGTVFPILGSPEDLSDIDSHEEAFDAKRWQVDVKRLLVLTGDYAHLYELGNIAFTIADDLIGADQLIYLKIAEDYLLTAHSLAPHVKDGRHNYLANISADLTKIQTAIAEAEKPKFQEDIQQPYLIMGRINPYIIDRESGTLTATVAVPEEYFERDDTLFLQTPEDMIANYFSWPHPVYVRASQFNDPSATEHPLRVTHVELDQPGPHDDPYDLAFNYYIDQESLDRTLFGRPMQYYRVEFALDSAGEILGTNQLQLCDVVLRNWDGTLRRQQKGAVVIQRTDGENNRNLIFSDSHVSYRDWLLLKGIETLEEIQTIAKTNGLEIPEGAVPPITEDEKRLAARTYDSANARTLAALHYGQFVDNSARLFLNGDNYDYAQEEHTLVAVDGPLTNAHLVEQMIGDYSKPVYGDTGNHDYHGYQWEMSARQLLFSLCPPLRKYLPPLDYALFSDGPGWFNSLKGLETAQHENDLSYFWGIVANFFADEVFGETIKDLATKYQKPKDGALEGHRRYLSATETFSIQVGSKERIFFMPTGSEFIRAGYVGETFLKPMFHEWQRLQDEEEMGMWEAFNQSYQNQASQTCLNTSGPPAESFVALLYTLEQNDQTTIFGHVSIFPPEEVSNLAHSNDVMDPNVSISLLMVLDFHRWKINGVIAGHAHQGSVTWFDGFEFEDGEERIAYYRKLLPILTDKDETTIYADLNVLAEEYDLIDRIQTRGHSSDPNTIVASGGWLNHSIPFVTIPAVGTNSSESDNPGFASLELGSQFAVDIDYFDHQLDGATTVYDTLEPYQQERIASLRAWQEEQKTNDWVATNTTAFFDPLEFSKMSLSPHGPLEKLLFSLPFSDNFEFSLFPEAFAQQPKTLFTDAP